MSDLEGYNNDSSSGHYRDDNGDHGPLARALIVVDVDAIQHWVKDKLAHNPDPHTWTPAEQIVMQLVAEVARYRRALKEEPIQVEHIEAVPTGESCAYCNSLNMVRTGSCFTCLNCGESGGCV